MIGREYELGSALLQAGRVDEARALLQQAVKQEPSHYDALHLLGLIAWQTGECRDAANLIGKAIALFPRNADFHSNRGGALRGLGRLEEALACFDAAIALKNDSAEFHYNRGMVLSDLGRWSEALASYDRAIALRPSFAEALCNRGHMLREMGQFEFAIEAYSGVIGLEPDFLEAIFNRGAVLLKLARGTKALADFERCLALKPDLAEAHYGRGNALALLGRTDEARAAYATALHAIPDAKRQEFVLHLGMLKDTSLILDLSREVAASRLDKKERREIPEFRLRHDLEQSAYLIAEGYAFPGLRQAHDTLRELCAGRKTSGLAVHALSNRQARDIHFFSKRLQTCAIEAPQDCLNPANDWRALEDRYFASRPEIVVIDDFLSHDALRAFRKFCLVSTIWRAEYPNRYLGAFAADGFLAPIHLQLATELQQRMPRILADQTLEQLWAFKYDPQTNAGIDAHADFAKINLNFWITPDEANLDPSSGGMCVYETACPPSWPMQDYNGNPQAVRAFLAAAGGGKRKIPYRCNRAVLFNSNLFHETDEIQFREGYENRRINITYLFGRGLAT